LQKLGAQVAGYSLPPPTEPSLFELAGVAGRIESSQIADIRDLPALEAAVAKAEPEIVLHLAAQPLVRESYNDPIGTYASNVMGTANVLQAMRPVQSVRAALCITTDKVYDNNGQSWGYRENDPLGGYDPYSSSKACAEILVASFRSSFFRHSQPPAIATARAGNVIGGGDWATDRLVPDLMRAFIRNEPAVIRYPHAVRPWQHVLEPLSGYLMLCEKLHEQGREFAQAWNFGPALADAQPVSQIVAQTAALWGDGRSFRIDSTEQPHEAAFLYLDTSLCQRKLGYRPTWMLGRALEMTVEWYRAFAANEDMGAVSIGQIETFIAERSAP